MLGARTKQVVSYGKRNKRIVNVSDEMAYRTAKQEDPFQVVQPLTRSSNSQENDVAPRAPAPPKKVCVVVLPKRKRAPFVVSPSSVKNRMHPFKTVTKRDSSIGTGTPSRRPFGLISNNVPVTPVASVVSRKQAKPRTSHTPQSSVKPISPFVNLDIIVTDDRGQRVSEEKRVFRTDIQINSLVSEPNTRVHGVFAPGKSDVIDLCDSDEEVVVRPARAAGKRVARQVVVSDDSDDDSISVLSSSKGTSRLLSKGKDRPKPILIASSDSDGGVNTTKESRASNTIRIPGTRVHDPKPTRDPSGYRPLAMKLPSTPPVVMRSRQLTPIKRNNFPRPPLALSPATSSSLDLSIDFEGLSLSPSLLDQPVEPQPRFILPLLQECGQTRPHEFSAFIETFPFDPIVHAAGGSGEVRFQKIGEASYSEVFGIGDVVLKVIPLRLEGAFNPFADLEKEGPAPSEAKDVLKEIIVTQTMGEICEGFVTLLRSYVVRGRYPSLLLDLWDKYAETKGSESVRPDSFNLSQVYAIIVLPNGGPDLEAFTFANATKTGWRQACSIFWQVTKALAQAEELVRFEHRDLHWGQILVKILATDGPTSKKNATAGAPPVMDHPSHGVRATLIDLGLSRMDASDGSESVGLHWTPFDEEVFEGEGDYQFDIYRMMREVHGGDWEGFRPLTNVMWLHYLLVKLLRSKRLRAPAAPRATAKTPRKTAIISVWSERECWEALVETEQMLGKRVDTFRPMKKAAGRGRKKVLAMVQEPLQSGLGSAQDVRDWGVSRGWLDR